MKTSVLILGVLAAIGCKREVQAKQPADPSPFRVEVSGVHFEGDEAVECIDMAATTDRNPADRSKAEQAVAELMSSRLKKNGAVLIHQACGQQFGGRPIFARCVLPSSVDGPLTISLQTSFLSFGFVSGDDQIMKDCLSEQGRWSEMPRDSSEFIQAKLHHDSKTLQRLAGVR